MVPGVWALAVVFGINHDAVEHAGHLRCLGVDGEVGRDHVPCAVTLHVVGRRLSSVAIVGETTQHEIVYHLGELGHGRHVGHRRGLIDRLQAARIIFGNNGDAVEGQRVNPGRVLHRDIHLGRIEAVLDQQGFYVARWLNQRWTSGVGPLSENHHNHCRQDGKGQQCRDDESLRTARTR